MLKNGFPKNISRRSGNIDREVALVKFTSGGLRTTMAVSQRLHR